MIRFSALLALVVASAPALACPQMDSVDVPYAADGATILDGGGVLMTTQRGFNRREDGPNGGLHLRADGADVEVTSEYLAPNLSILRPKQAQARTLELVNRKGDVVRTYPEDLGGTPLAAPAGTVASTLTPAVQKATRPPYPASAEMVITLAKDPPADAAILIVVVGAAKNRTGIAWAPAAAGQRAYTFSQGGKGCYPGPAAARVGERVMLEWVDVHGRISAVSRPITVGLAQRR